MSKQSDGAAWKKTINTKNGPVEVLSITIGDKRYTAWPNTFKKEGERSPDYRLQVDTYEAKFNAEDAKQYALNKEKLKSIQSEDLPF